MMSSPIDRAVRRAQWAPVMSAAAALLGLSAVGLFVYQAGLFQALNPEDKPPPPHIETPEQIAASQTNIEGFDREKQPYRVSADRAVQDKSIVHHVHLENVTGSFKKTAGDVYDVSARTGLYDTKAEELELEGGVTVASKDRFTASMQKAHVSVKDKRLVSNVPVSVDLGGGSAIEAGGLEISNNGDRIVFVNRVKATFKRSVKGDGSP